MLIFYETWQYECCGKPFRVGDIVEWPIYKYDDYDDFYYYEKHAGKDIKVQHIQGRVTSITAEYITFKAERVMETVLRERNETIEDSQSAFSEKLKARRFNEDKTEYEDFQHFWVTLEDVIFLD